jgi:hypothetical protein
MKYKNSAICKLHYLITPDKTKKNQKKKQKQLKKTIKQKKRQKQAKTSPTSSSASVRRDGSRADRQKTEEA